MSLALSQSCNQYNSRRPMIQNHIQKHYPRLLFLRRKPGGLRFGVRGPIGRWKSDPPETRRWLREFHRNRRRACQFVIHRNYAALLLLSAACVLQKKSLPPRYHALQGQQRPMRTDHNCFRALRESRTFLWGPVDNNGNAQINPLAAPIFQPTPCFSEFFVGHTKSG